MAALAAVPYGVLLLPALVVGSVLAAVALAVRAVRRIIEPPFVPWTDLITFDPRLGWRPKPAIDAHYLAEHDDVYRLVTDDEGWPGSGSVEQSPVIAVGDSFAFGYGVDTDSSFAALNPGVAVKAVGAPGYSMVHGVLLMEQLGRRLAGKLVVWLVFLENDLQDSLVPEMRQYRAPFLRQDDDGAWSIVTAHVSPTAWRTSNLDHVRLFPNFCVPGPLADRAFSAAEHLIGAAAACCRRAGARLVLVTIPHVLQLTPAGQAELAARSAHPRQFGAEYPDCRLAESCAAHRVPMVAGTAYFRPADYKHREGIHWNQRGHRRMADLIADLYRRYRAERLEELVPPAEAPGPGPRIPRPNREEAVAQL